MKRCVRFHSCRSYAPNGQTAHSLKYCITGFELILCSYTLLSEQCCNWGSYYAHTDRRQRFPSAGPRGLKWFSHDTPCATTGFEHMSCKSLLRRWKLSKRLFETFGLPTNIVLAAAVAAAASSTANANIAPKSHQWIFRSFVIFRFGSKSGKECIEWPILRRKINYLKCHCIIKIVSN